MAASFTEARDEIKTRAEAADLTVCLRVEDIRPPCVWLKFLDYDHGFLGGGGEVRFYVYLIALPKDDERLLEDLEEMLDTLVGAGVQPSENTTLVGVQVPENPQPLPAFQVTTSLTIGS